MDGQLEEIKNEHGGMNECKNIGIDHKE